MSHCRYIGSSGSSSSGLSSSSDGIPFLLLGFGSSALRLSSMFSGVPSSAGVGGSLFGSGGCPSSALGPLGRLGGPGGGAPELPGVVAIVILVSICKVIVKPLKRTSL